MDNLKFVLDAGAFPPERAHPTDAGADLRSPVPAMIYPHDSVVIDTGVHVAIPNDYAGELISKSGLNVHYSVLSTGLIDSEYTGSITVKLYNHSKKAVKISRGDKITQLVIYRVECCGFERVDSLEETARGDNCFGSTGR